MKQLTLSRFINEFHQGMVNRILHAMGFILLTLAVWFWNWKLLLFSMALQEAGHIYHHIFVEHKVLHFGLSDILRWQTLFGGLVFILYASLILIIKRIIYGN